MPETSVTTNPQLPALGNIQRLITSLTCLLSDRLIAVL